MREREREREKARVNLVTEKTRRQLLGLAVKTGGNTFELERKKATKALQIQRKKVGL